MKKWFLLSAVMMSCTVHAMQNQPAGYWQTIDDVTHEPKAVVELSLEKNETLTGKIVKLYHNENKRCEPCKGDKHNQPILGMEILSGLKLKSDYSWSDGSILDPKNGKTYNCTLTLKNQGKELEVRGYIGIPLLGRTQTWVRVNHLPS